MTAKSVKQVEISAEQVREFLKSHPDFLKTNPDILNATVPPERDLGEGVVDFQHYMVKNLQKDSQALRSRYDVLVDYCRENMSAQAQVHGAALKLMHTRNLEQLLEAITIDLVSLFDVDVVRMAMESEAMFDTSYGEQNYSGFVFIPPGTVDAALGKKKNVLLIEDCTVKQPPGFDEIFSDCEAMIASCALLRLDLEMVGKNVVLAFGVRYKDRFHPGQGVELLHFLAQIVSHQLDMYLSDLTA
jgi:uncharacterized protein YigA (DUF484 family)